MTDMSVPPLSTLPSPPAALAAALQPPSPTLLVLLLLLLCLVPGTLAAEWPAAGLHGLLVCCSQGGGGLLGLHQAGGGLADALGRQGCLKAEVPSQDGLRPALSEWECDSGAVGHTMLEHSKTDPKTTQPSNCNHGWKGRPF